MDKDISVETQKKWQETGRIACGPKVCPECCNDKVRKARGGIVKEYFKSSGGVKRYAYRCEQTDEIGQECGLTAEVSLDPASKKEGDDFIMNVGAVMERSYLDNTAKKLKNMP